MKEKKIPDLIVDHFSLTLVNLLLACIYQSSCVSHLEPWQSNLSNPEAYSGLCQKSKMDCFAKIEKAKSC